MRSLLLFVTAVTSGVSVFGQTAIPDRMNAAGALIQQGHYAEAIATLKTIDQSSPLSDHERGRAETLLGLAYKDTGHMLEAEQSYEKALTMLAHGSLKSPDYGRALSCLGSLKLEAGDLESGARALRQAAQVENQLNDHVGLTTVDLHLVSIAINRKHWREARRYLEAAKAQASLSGTDARALSADIDGTTGWLASVTSHTSEAVSAYTDALEDCKRVYGVQHPLTGWAYLLAGKASAMNGDVPAGLATMRAGLAILKDTVGTRNAKYLTGELAYAKVLEQAGMHPEAQQVHAEASWSLASLHGQECMSCTVSVWSLQNR
ncbi:MAG: tetratricopeptide repeat protein [Terracidiphilus sp.]